MVSLDASSTPPAAVINPDCTADFVSRFLMEKPTFKRNWLDLPLEILEQILSNLYGDDVRSFHSVCKSWDAVVLDERFLVRKEHDPLTSPQPESQWLVHKNAEELTYQFLHPMYPYVACSKNLLQGRQDWYPGATIWCSRDGWLLMSSKFYSMFFLCPFSEIIINLPELSLQWNIEFHGVTFTADSGCPTDGGVIFMISYYGSTHVEIASLRIEEDNVWKYTSSDNNIPFKPSYSSNPVFYKGMFYCLSIDGKLGVYNPKEDTWTVLEKPQPLKPRKWHYESHLVEHQGGLMSMFMGESGSWVSIFKLNESDMVWENVYGLGDYALFISISTSFARDNVLDKMKNKIFFPYFHKHSQVFYCLETKTFQTFGSDLYVKNLCKTEIAEQLESCWIEPAVYVPRVYSETIDETNEGAEYEANDELGSEEEEEDESNNDNKHETSDESRSKEVLEDQGQPLCEAGEVPASGTTTLSGDDDDIFLNYL